MWMLGQQTEGDHEVRLTAAHGLGQLEGGLVGASCKPQQGFAEQGIHALGYVVSGEELRPVTFAADQIREILNGLGHPVIVDHRMDLADIPNGSQHINPRVCVSAQVRSACICLYSRPNKSEAVMRRHISAATVNLRPSSTFWRWSHLL